MAGERVTTVRLVRESIAEQVYAIIKDLIVLIRHLIRDETHKANEEHITLLEAILERDKERAKEILKDHIDRVARSVCS